MHACRSFRLKEKVHETTANMSYDEFNEILKLGVLRKFVFVVSFWVHCKNT